MANDNDDKLQKIRGVAETLKLSAASLQVIGEDFRASDAEALGDILLRILDGEV